MIGKLQGQLEIISENQALIMVSGVGYLVFCSKKTLEAFGSGEYAELLIETHVREDHIHLYGFANNEEKQSFNLMQSVKGVGTKMALTILSQLAPDQIQNALIQQDNLIFQQVSGVGKKLAERIVIELKDKFTSPYPHNIRLKQNNPTNNKASDAVIALTNLGINRSEAQMRINHILSHSPDLAISELIKLGLKKI